jgi:hypothetical protein
MPLQMHLASGCGICSVNKINDRKFGTFVFFYLLLQQEIINTMLDTIIFSKTKGTLEISVSVYVFKENDVFIAYCPSLDISGYNTTEEEARHDFEYALNEYVKFQMEHDTLNKDLARHGLGS